MKKWSADQSVLLIVLLVHRPRVAIALAKAQALAKADSTYLPTFTPKETTSIEILRHRRNRTFHERRLDAGAAERESPRRNQ